MEDLVEIIEAQDKGNGAGLGWTNNYIKDETEAREIREICLNNQLELRRVKFANEFNPAAAVYGESQVGKSYLVDNLLMVKGMPLKIFDGKKEGGYGFIESINPIGGGKESTSLISRFTIKSYKSSNDEYPICAVMLTPIDIVLILCDAYYNDVIHQNFPDEAAVKEFVSRLKTRFAGQKSIQTIVNDVDIYEIKDYLTGNLFQKGDEFRNNLKKAKYFEVLSECINSIGPNDWAEVFGFLWNNNPNISKVFVKLIGALQQLGFPRRCYININPLLRLEGTILQVDRLYELFGLSEVSVNGKVMNVERADVQDMCVWNDEQQKLISGVQKSEFCALTSEIVFNIHNSNDSNSDALLQEKPFLEYMDVLDFPGARSRKIIDNDQITEAETCLMLLRGKVAYLFNKYSKQYLISNLLFCHHDLKSEVSTLSLLLKSWIEKTVGKTPEERQEYINSCEISPLFIVGTKFNTDLVRQPIDSMGTETQKLQVIKQRWTKRFNSTLTDLIHETQDDPWFSRWTPNSPFKNIYLLRAYNYSCESGVYEGYEKCENGTWIPNPDENGNLKEVSISESYKPFIAKLKESFLENDFVQQHFDNPEKSWNEAVEVNHDGSAWIIENLTKSSRKAKASRELKFDKIVKQKFADLYRTFREKYHDDKADSNLKEALGDAGRIDLMLDTLFGKDKYFFSDFIDSMLVREDDLHDVIINAINGIKVLDKTDLSVLFAIRDRAKVDNNESEDENRKRIREAYHCSADEELDNYLQSLGLTIEDIINPPQVMNIGRIIIGAIEKYWFDEHLSLEKFQEFVDRGLTSKDISVMFSRMKALYYEELNMTDKVNDQIRQYISAPQQLDDMVDMLADICSEMINKFVNTMGTAYFGKGLWDRVQKTVDFNKFDINVDVAEKASIEFDDDAVKQDVNEVFDMFDHLDDILNEVPVDRKKLQHFSNYKTYRLWTERMKVAFLAICGIPNYDVKANNELKLIFQNKIVGVGCLKTLLTSDMDVACFI